ncbi:MAG TPA: hypothetical protein VIU29_01745, partial [Candidatus Deferrimicrobiaceae bacterium]
HVRAGHAVQAAANPAAASADALPGAATPAAPAAKPGNGAVHGISLSGSEGHDRLDAEFEKF